MQSRSLTKELRGTGWHCHQTVLEQPDSHSHTHNPHPSLELLRMDCRRKWNVRPLDDSVEEHRGNAQSMIQERKIRMLDSCLILKSCSTKGTVKSMKNKSQTRRNFFTKHISDKGFASKIHKQPLKFNGKKTNNLILKRAADISLNMITRWQMSTSKHTPCHALLRNCNYSHSWPHGTPRAQPRAGTWEQGLAMARGHGESQLRWVRGQAARPLWKTVWKFLFIIAVDHFFLVLETESRDCWATSQALLIHLILEQRPTRFPRLSLNL